MTGFMRCFPREEGHGSSGRVPAKARNLLRPGSHFFAGIMNEPLRANAPVHWEMHRGAIRIRSPFEQRYVEKMPTRTRV
jgi:hypothetical protein